MPNENPGIEATGGQTGVNPPETFTKEQKERVNELMQKRVERSRQAFFNRYGVKDLKGLDDLFAKANSVDGLNGRIEELTKEKEDLQSKFDETTLLNKNLTKEHALSSRNIRPEKRSDIETYFKGKGIDIDEATLDEELKTHADWVNKTGTVAPITNEPHKAPQLSEAEFASKIFGVELH